MILDALRPAQALKHIVLGTGEVHTVPLRNTEYRRQRQERMFLRGLRRQQMWRNVFPQVSELYLWGHVWPRPEPFKPILSDGSDSANAIDREWWLKGYPSDRVIACSYECSVDRESGIQSNFSPLC